MPGFQAGIEWGFRRNEVRATIRHNLPRDCPIRAAKKHESPRTLASYSNEEWTMSASIREINGSREINGDATRSVSSAWRAGRRESWWSQHREASLNWLAFGVLLAAWNAADNGAAAFGPAPSRPQALRGYSSVSVRAATLHSAQLPDLPIHS